MSKQLETVKIMLDYLQGPIWLSDIESGDPNTGIDVVDNDSIVKELNYKCAELFNGYYEFDSHGQACWFNHEKEKDKSILLDLITRLVFRLNEINDGSYIIEDYENGTYKKTITAISSIILQYTAINQQSV